MVVRAFCACERAPCRRRQKAIASVDRGKHFLRCGALLFQADNADAVYQQRDQGNAINQQAAADVQLLKQELEHILDRNMREIEYGRQLSESKRLLKRIRGFAAKQQAKGRKREQKHAYALCYREKGIIAR